MRWVGHVARMEKRYMHQNEMSNILKEDTSF